MSRSDAKSTPNRTPLWWVMRGVWGSLATMHLWPFASLTQNFITEPSVLDAFWLASLVVVVAVFGLKAVDSARLRLHRPGVEFTAFVIVAAMIHGDAVVREGYPVVAVETATTAVVAAGAVVIVGRRASRRYSEFLRGLSRLLRLAVADRRPVAFVWVADRLSPDRVAYRCAPARAPPPLIF
jgi:hypothetical protein